MSILDISIKYKLEDFLYFHRLQPIFIQMFSEFKYLEPNKQFLTSEPYLHEVLYYCWEYPSNFYYSPNGLYLTTSIFYIMHVILVSILIYKKQYPYKEITLLEIIVWIFNFGYILHEIFEILFKGDLYWSYGSNYFDILICLN